jgi:hypothetical protein
MELKKYIEHLPLNLQKEAQELLAIARKVDLEIEVIETAENLLDTDESLSIIEAINCSLYEWDII